MLSLYGLKKLEVESNHYWVLWKVVSLGTAVGLGSPPEIWKNDRTESLHSVMKEELRNESWDIDTLLERVKDRVFDEQVEEMITAIYGMGELDFPKTTSI